ncbi:ecto-ADP-ribosyltransferase 5-like [Mobula hypostoma]|uniref:ecto-ADP-ribosyltransferase 5-like n=1 Tax=Mobula hypostoma TaxID=723540 RepID=UPI002FC353BE
METKRLCSWVLILGITLGPSFLGSEARAVGTNTDRIKDAIQLGIEENSAAYIFTQSKTSDQLAIDYLEKERQRNTTLDQVWDRAVKGMGDKPLPDGLRREHLLAVYAYTDSERNQFYREFNNAVRMYGTSDSVYAGNFPFKSVHYLLSVALDRLREIAGSAPGTTYRGMVEQVLPPKNNKMRFGYFASSSLNTSIAMKYAGKTLFEIKSQFGVAIYNHSRIPEEMEVLIPPFEVFNVTNVSTGNGRVTVSLEGVGSEGIPVKVERGKGGEMRVVRSSGVTFSPRLCILALLVHIFA